ncbi:hypothetical protein POM88_024448 [Heracleum sosnowskyi]|uniref:Uncharacterized protein n=1 Tax=Heracleum sosnowskyi TaxID=360622 RepID=A0AAD8MMB0_9APIA|nr:hypothetical protein POM88_024448 [Heracleum sosnowskyi]
MRSTVSDSGNGDSEVQRTMLELLNQLDGFEASNKIKVISLPPTIRNKDTKEKAYKGLGIANAKMLKMRELYGTVTTSVKGKYNFREEYTKRLVSQPLACPSNHKHIIDEFIVLFL